MEAQVGAASNTSTAVTVVTGDSSPAAPGARAGPMADAVVAISAAESLPGHGAKAAKRIERVGVA